MDVFVWLFGMAAALALVPRFGVWAQGAALLFGCLAGVRTPDLDFALGLSHRSGLTHGVMPWALMLLRRDWWPGAAGLAMGLGLHLAADSFPNAMVGMARVTLPGAGRFGAGASYVWLGASALVSLVGGVWLSLRLFALRVAVGLLIAAAAIGVAYLWATDGGWPVLAIGGAGGWLAWRVRRLPLP